MSAYGTLMEIFERSRNYVPKTDHEYRMFHSLGPRVILRQGGRRDNEFRIMKAVDDSHYDLYYSGARLVRAWIDGRIEIYGPGPWPTEKIASTLNIVLWDTPYRAHLRYEMSPFGGRTNERIMLTHSRKLLSESPHFTPTFPVTIGPCGELTMPPGSEVAFPKPKRTE